MILPLLLGLSGSAATTPADLVDQAFRGRAGSRWSATVLVERPRRGVLDTAKACREGTSERLDFKDGSLWMAGDSVVFLRNSERTANVHHRGPPPGDWNAKLVGREKYLGRPVLVFDATGPFGRGHRVWVDTSLPAVLKDEPTGPSGPPIPERQFLSIRSGTGCAPDAFRIPEGWVVRESDGPPEGGGRGHGRRHEAASLAELVAAVGFQPPPPPWLPEGFQPRSWAWVETREGKAAQIFYANGARSVSVFWRASDGPPPFCPATGCRDRKGAPVFFGQVGNLGLAVTGNLSPADLEHVAGVRK